MNIETNRLIIAELITVDRHEPLGKITQNTVGMSHRDCRTVGIVLCQEGTAVDRSVLNTQIENETFVQVKLATC